MKWFLSLLAIPLIVISAYFFRPESVAHTKKFPIKLGMSSTMVSSAIGLPTSTDKQKWIYIFDDQSELILSFRDEALWSATLNYHDPKEIQDPDFKELTLVQVGIDLSDPAKPAYFYVGEPKEGKIWKVNANGRIESLTWVPPFGNEQTPKNIQALYRDFRGQYNANM
jgi:hypothetical protein